MLQHCTQLHASPLRSFAPHQCSHFPSQLMLLLLLLLLLLLPVSSVNIDLKSIHLPLRQCLIFDGPSAQLEVFISRENFSPISPSKQTNLPPWRFKHLQTFAFRKTSINSFGLNYRYALNFYKK